MPLFFCFKRQEMIKKPENHEKTLLFFAISPPNYLGENS